MKKVMRILIMSIATCFSLTFALILINSIMGIFVGLDYYFTMAVVLTVCMSIGLILYDSKSIFSKKKRVPAKGKLNKEVKLRKQQSQSARRKIS